MRTLLPFLLTPLLPAQGPAPDATRHLDLKVLYAGRVDHPRTEAWRAFLEPRTDGFRAIAAGDLTTEATEGFDVVVLDTPDPLERNAEGTPQRIAVPEVRGLTAAFGRPTIVVGGMALRTDRLDLKVNWL